MLAKENDTIRKTNLFYWENVERWLPWLGVVPAFLNLIWWCFIVSGEIATALISCAGLIITALIGGIVTLIVDIRKTASNGEKIDSAVKGIDSTVQKTKKLLGATEENTIRDMIDASTEKVTGAIGGISEKLAFLQGVQSSQKEPLQQMQGAIESFAKTLAENNNLHREVEQLQQVLTEREQEILSKDIQIESLTAEVIDLEEKLNAALQPPQAPNMDFTP